MRLEPVDVIGFSAGGFIAAEMVGGATRDLLAAWCWSRRWGSSPNEGEIMDIFAAHGSPSFTVDRRRSRRHPRFAQDLRRQMTPEQFEAFEDARAETARIGWEPFMHNPSLPHLLRGVKTPTLLVWGTRDEVVPRGCVDAYEDAIANRPGRSDRRRRPSSGNRELGRVRAARQELPGEIN